MLQHVYERASQARYLTSTIVATDDDRVYEAARGFGARVRMTRKWLPPKALRSWSTFKAMNR